MNHQHFHLFCWPWADAAWSKLDDSRQGVAGADVSEAVLSDDDRAEASQEARGKTKGRSYEGQ